MTDGNLNSKHRTGTIARLAWVGIFILFTRIIVIWYGGQSFAPNGGDQPVYHLTALKLSKEAGEWFKPGSEFGYRAPAYFCFLSLVYWVHGDPPFWIGQLTSAFLGTITSFLIYLLARNITGKEIAYICLLLRGFLPSFVMADTLVLSEPLFATLLLSTLLLLSRAPYRPRILQVMGMGVLTGCMLLTREVATFYPLLFLVYLWVVSEGWYKKAAIGFVFVASILVILAPWIWRNDVVWGSGLPISYTSGVNLHIGNNPHATGNWVRLQPDDQPKNLSWASPEWNAWHRSQALEYIANNPFRFVGLGFRKLAWFVWPRFLREDINQIYPGPHWAVTLISTTCGFMSAIFLMLAVTGVIFRDRDWYWWIVAMLFAYSLVTTFVVVGEPRYRDPLDNLFIPFAAFIILNLKTIGSTIVELRSNSRPRAFALILILLYLVCNWVWVALNRGTA
jgi:4-amino-4-deoxy-L-arabinose transferase-like glycosyltransferase